MNDTDLYTGVEKPWKARYSPRMLVVLLGPPGTVLNAALAFMPPAPPEYTDMRVLAAVVTGFAMLEPKMLDAVAAVAAVGFTVGIPDLEAAANGNAGGANTAEAERNSSSPAGNCNNAVTTVTRTVNDTTDHL